MVMLGLMLMGVTIERSAAQAKPAGTAQKTTLNGVYTARQATAGEETYYTLCISCHPKGTYAGPGFKSNWSGRPLSDLFDWVLNKMPKNDPGSLTPAESVQVIAYILQQNKMPAGKVALPANEKTLYGIKIQIK
jgi:mono/diheme cytochrome c family protein